MREVLFRGKRLDNGEWVEGNLVFSADAEEDWEAIIVPRINSNMFTKKGAKGNLGFENWHRVDHKTVCQFTGMTDKNGVKIFDGDICRNIKSEEIVSVKWHGTMAGYVWTKRKENNKHLFDFGELFRAFDKYEVISNIFDNPELLKGGAE